MINSFHDHRLICWIPRFRIYVCVMVTDWHLYSCDRVCGLDFGEVHIFPRRITFLESTAACVLRCITFPERSNAFTRCKTLLERSLLVQVSGQSFCIYHNNVQIYILVVWSPYQIFTAPRLFKKICKNSLLYIRLGCMGAVKCRWFKVIFEMW